MKTAHRSARLALVVTTVVALFFSSALAGSEDEKRDERYRIAEEVNKKITALSDFGAFDWIQVYVGDGTLTLVGDVARARLKSNAGEVAEKVKGVERVNNDLLFLGRAPRDREVRARVYQAIYNTYLPQYAPYLPGERPVGELKPHGGPHPIHIIVHHGNVTLMGYVHSAGDRAEATKAAKTAMGVASVSNHLAIVPKPEKKK